MFTLFYYISIHYLWRAKKRKLILEACPRRPGGRASKRPGGLDDVDSGDDVGDVLTPRD